MSGLRRSGSAVLASALVVPWLVATVPGAAQAADTPATTGGSSSRTIAWPDQPRHPDDLADAGVRKALEDWRLTVSQTRDLLNQTVEVSWTGAATTGSGTFLQLMQCWSDGPDVPPTREQCAYGGTDREGAEGFGSGKTRQLGSDTRERDYRFDADLVVVSVDGASPTARWSPSAPLVLGTNSSQCPSSATGWSVVLVPPRDVIGAGTLPASVVLQPLTPGTPPTVTRPVNGRDRTYAATTPPIQLSELPALPAGQYRVQLGCFSADGAEVTRFVGYVEAAVVDGAKVLRAAAREGGVFVPFDPLGSTADTAPTDPYVRNDVLEYLKPRTTNEVFAGRTRPDGGGSVFMEVQTDIEAQHLGCGRVDGGTPRSCWVVAVPRWAGEPDGSQPELATLTSPLSQTLWDRRIAVPLAFAPVAAGCTIGSGLKQVLTHDSALAALRSWQPTFCKEVSTASSVLGPLQDFSIRLGVSQPNRMGIVTVPEEGIPTLVAAPIATSAVVVGFVVDRQVPFGSPEFVDNETRSTVLNLNARLVAKLLTQSYDSGAAPNGGKAQGYNGSTPSGSFQPVFTPARDFPADNPRTLYQDPEFLDLNPDFVDWLEEGASTPPDQMAEILVSANDTDAYQVLWQWVVSDPDARAFLAGTPDAGGMTINPYYEDQITAKTSSFPQLDPTCVDRIEDPVADAFPLLCQINNHPRVEDDTKAAQAAVRGDTKRVNVIPSQLTGAPGERSYRAEPRQPQGKGAMLVLTTSGVAERFGLPTARLRNASGALVGPTAAAMSAARDQMLLRDDGVLVAAPEQVTGGGYPLTTMSYAVVDVAVTTEAQNKAFATVLDYAAGAGQRSGTAIGQLPPGYAPLPATLRARTSAAAATLRDPAALLVTDEPTDEVTAPPTTGGEGPQAPRALDGSGPPPVVPVSGPVAAGPLQPVPSPAPAPAPAPAIAAPLVALPTQVTGGVTPMAPWTVPALLAAGLLAAFAARVLRVVGGPAPRPPYRRRASAGRTAHAPSRAHPPERKQQ